MERLHDYTQARLQKAMGEYVKNVFTGEIDVIARLKLPVIERQKEGGFLLKGGNHQANN
jgi:hypothetical protein